MGILAQGSDGIRNDSKFKNFDKICQEEALEGTPVRLTLIAFYPKMGLVHLAKARVTTKKMKIEARKLKFCTRGLVGRPDPKISPAVSSSSPSEVRR